MGVKYREFKFYSDEDKLEIHGMILLPEGRPEGIVQILHGMCEHKERYYDFMKYLADRGFVCVIHDHRGHGMSTVSDADLGYFYDAGYKGLVEDSHQVAEYIKDYVGRNLPYILIGHSMGSMVARCYIKEYDDEVDKLLLLGSPSKQNGMKSGLALAKLLGVLKGARKHSKLLDYIVSGSTYERRFRKEKLLHAWINSDREAVLAYNEDRYCNFTFTISGYQELVKLMMDTYSEEGYLVKNKDLPVRFLSGGDDPCMLTRNSFGASVHFLKNVGYTNVRGGLYPGMRHEILNEKQKKRVYKDIYEFIKEA